mmetsp:Transcript_63424/g.129196  ORF Transcript_63424/g.129196 Transcript_63424/m.129196 type:complete len:200 (-) Transcript_63424:321-920(-)
MCVVVHGIPEAPVLLGALLHLLADEAIEDIHGALQGINALIHRLVVPGPLILLLGEEVLYGGAGCLLPLQELGIAGVVLIMRRFVLPKHVVEVLVGGLTNPPLAHELLLVGFVDLLAGLSLSRDLLLRVGMEPLACGLLMAEGLLHEVLMRLPSLLLAGEMTLHRPLARLASALFSSEVLGDGLVVVSPKLALTVDMLA